MVPVPTSEKVMVPVPTYEKLGTVPVPVPAPYLDHKKQIIQQKMLDFFLFFYIFSCFTREKYINFNKFIVKCE